MALPEELSDAVPATAGHESSVRDLAQVSLTSDGVFGDDGGASRLATVTGDVAAGCTASLAVGVDTRTVPAGGGPGGGRAPGGAPASVRPPSA